MQAHFGTLIKKQQEKIEMLQRRGPRYVTNIYRNTSSVDRRHDKTTGVASMRREDQQQGCV